MESESNSPQPAPEQAAEPKKKKVEKKPRGQILADYKISLRTFEEILGRKLLKGPITREKGKNFFEINANNDFMFRAARNHISSFKMIRNDSPALPFHRFLALRFVNTPPGETYEELLNSGLISGNGQFSRGIISKYYSQFIRRLPSEIRGDVVLKQEPTGREGQRLFRLFLKVIGVLEFYDNPQLIDDLSYIVLDKEGIEPILTTKSESEAVAQAIGTISGTAPPVAAVDAYRNLYYAVHEVGESEWDTYLVTKPVELRDSLKSARNMSLDEFAAHEGINELCEHKRVLEVLRTDVQTKFLKSARYHTGSAMQTARSHIDTFLKISDRLDKIGEGRIDIAKMFDKFIVVGAGDENGPIESAAEVLEQKKPESK